MQRFLLAGAIAAFFIPILAIAAGRPNQDVPRGPVIDFCPSPEQIDAHLAEYGFDYKPQPPNGAVCSRDGEVRAPSDPAEDPTPVSEEERCRDQRQAYLESEPLPDEDNDPLTFYGRKRNGGSVGVSIDGEPKALEGVEDIHDYARSFSC